MAEPDAKLNPAALPLPDAARLLSAAGGQRITLDMLEADRADGGRPANAKVSVPRGSGGRRLAVSVGYGDE